MECYFNWETQVYCEKGAINNVGDFLKENNVTKVFCVHGKSLARNNVKERLLQSIEDAGIECMCFDEILPDPPVSLVNKVAAEAKAFGADGMIGIGGGSVMDIAKCANILLTNPGDSIVDYVDREEGADTKGKYLILIPTTFGTGSEVTAGGVVSLEDKCEKASVWGNNIAADLAIIDPELSYPLPPGLTASTGMDALSHATEAYMSKLASPISDALALYAIELIWNNLNKAVANGKDEAAREAMCMAAVIAGGAFNNALVCQGHSLAHTMGANWHVPHGAACAFSLPFAIKENAPELRAKMIKLSTIFGIEVTDSMSNEEIGNAVADAVTDYVKRIGIGSLGQFDGVNKDEFRKIAEIFYEMPAKYVVYQCEPDVERTIKYLESIY